MSNRLKRIAMGMLFDGPRVVREWLMQLSDQERAAVEALYRRLAQKAKARGLIS